MKHTGLGARTQLTPTDNPTALPKAMSPPSNDSEDHKSGKAPFNRASDSRKTTNYFTADVSKDLNITLVPLSSGSKGLQNVIVPSNSQPQAEKTAKPPFRRASDARNIIKSVPTGVPEEQSAEKMPPSGSSNALQ
jgi:hypothetical protein